LLCHCFGFFLVCRCFNGIAGYRVSGFRFRVSALTPET
jgi:hypothetical protein